MCGVFRSHLFGGGPGKRRTCEQQCRRRKSRRTSPVRPAEAGWGSAPGCSSPDPTQINEGQLYLAFFYFLISALLQLKCVVTDGDAYRLSEVALSRYIIQTQTYPGLMQPYWMHRENSKGQHSVTRYSPAQINTGK